MSLGQPVEPGLPGPLLALGQLDRLGGAIAQKVGRGVAQHLVDRSAAQRGHAVERRADQPGERHAGPLDGLALRPPFVGDRLGERRARQHQELPGRGVDRPAVEQNAMAAGRGRVDADVLVEALHAGAAASSSSCSKRSMMTSAPASSSAATG